jgi:hypothetical protein
VGCELWPSLLGLWCGNEKSKHKTGETEETAEALKTQPFRDQLQPRSRASAYERWGDGEMNIYDIDDFGDGPAPVPVRQKYEIIFMQIDGIGGLYGLFGEMYRRPIAVNQHIQPLVDSLLPSDPFDLEIVAA